MLISFTPLGDRAFLARFSTESDAAGWARAVRGQGWPGIVDVVLAYESAAVFADPEQTDLDQLEARLRSLDATQVGRLPGKLVRLPVLYDGEDLGGVSRSLGIAENDLVELHSGNDYHVFAIGFLPGFPYAGYLPNPLCGLPRRDVPRLRVPAGTVAIVGRQTGIYPAESPGGWHLIGRTPLRIVNLNENHFPIRAGDRIRFVPIDPLEFEARKGQSL